MSEVYRGGGGYVSSQTLVEEQHHTIAGAMMCSLYLVLLREVINCCRAARLDESCRGPGGSGRGPDADRTIEFKETDAGRTRAWPFLPGRVGPFAGWWARRMIPVRLHGNLARAEASPGVGDGARPTRSRSFDPYRVARTGCVSNAFLTQQPRQVRNALGVGPVGRFEVFHHQTQQTRVRSLARRVKNALGVGRFEDVSSPNSAETRQIIRNRTIFSSGRKKTGTDVLETLGVGPVSWTGMGKVARTKPRLCKRVGNGSLTNMFRETRHADTLETDRSPTTTIGETREDDTPETFKTEELAMPTRQMTRQIMHQITRQITCHLHPTCTPGQRIYPMTREGCTREYLPPPLYKKPFGASGELLRAPPVANRAAAAAAGLHRPLPLYRTEHKNLNIR
eukprot:gene12791-biopygen4969